MRQGTYRYLYEPEDPEEPVRVFLVEYQVSRVYPQRYADHNGPGYPAEGGEVTILSIDPEPDDPKIRTQIIKWIEDNPYCYQEQ
jgi:hypothetical protein